VVAPTYKNWTPVDAPAAQALTTMTNSPGVIYPVGTNALPPNLQHIPGVSSYFISGYVNPHDLKSGLTAIGEMLVARSDGATTKNYNYLVAANSAGQMYFAGPYKGFGHHVTSGQTVAVNSLFGQTPLGSGT
jgi:hypothetical protein